MWRQRQPVAQHYERHFDGRVIRCFRDRPASVQRMLSDIIARHPARDCLVGDEEKLSYSAIDERTNRLAVALRSRGIEPGDRVAILIGNRVAFVESVLACLRLGAIAVPLSIRMAAPEITYCLEDCGAVGLIHQPDDVDLPNDLEALRMILSSDEERVGEGEVPWAQVKEEDTVFILYTSGTTGRPKGAMLTGINTVHSVLHFRYAMELDETDRTLLAVPGSHVTGLIATIMTTLGVGGALVLQEDFKAKACLDLISRERVTNTILVPAMYNLMLLEPDFDQYELSNWRIGGYGGAPMPQATIAGLAERVPGLGLMNAYGSTELTSPATLLPTDLAAERSDSVGCSVHCADIRIMDEDGVEVEPGETGEIWIAGPMVVPGYWRNPQATIDNFVAGYWRSGDVGSMDADGFLRVLDRKKDMINRGGYKIYSAEVENVLAAHPDVMECAVIGYGCPVLGERVLAILVPKNPEGSGDIEEAILAHARTHLSDYKIPERIEFRQTPLPRNPNGKVVKNMLRSQDTVSV